MNVVEVWKDIKEVKWINFTWIYQISNLWRIRNINYRWLWIQKILNPWNSKGYLHIQLYKNSIYVTEKIHRLVWYAFLKIEKDKIYINHKNWIRDDNRIENLEWCTKSQNEKHKSEVLWFKWPMYWVKWDKNHLSKKVNQYNLNWDFIKTWNSLSEISKNIWIDQWNISACCKWRLKTTGGFIFKYY